MADRYWVGGTAAWDGTAGTKWAITSGGSGGASVPTSADDVFFDANSGAVTVTISAAFMSCRNLTCTGFTGTLSRTNTPFNIHGSILFSPTMTWNQNNFSQALYGTSATITSNGKVFNGAIQIFDGASYTLADAASCGNFTVYPNSSFNTAGYAFSFNSLFTQSAGTRTISFGASTVTVANSWSVTQTTVLNAGTSTINLNGSSFGGLGLTYYNVTFTSSTAGTRSISGINTFNNLTVTAPSSAGVTQVTFDSRQTINGTLSTTGTAGNRRVWFRGLTYGISQTLTVNGTPSLTDADFMDLYVVGAAAPIGGTRIGDTGGCIGITFSTPKTVYYVNLAGGGWLGNNWSDTSGGAVNTDFYPLPQDTAIFDNASANSGVTITTDAGVSLCNIDASSRTTSLRINYSNNPTSYGDIIYGTGMLGSASNSSFLLRKRSGVQRLNATLSSSNRFNNSLFVDCLTGTVRLEGPLFVDPAFQQLQIISGTFDANGYNFTGRDLTTSGNLPKTVLLKNGTFSVTNFNFSQNTNLTLDAGTSQINASSFTGASTNLTFYNVSADTISGVNTFNNLSITAPGVEGIKTLIISGDQTITGTLTVAGASPVRRIFVRSNTIGTTRTLNVGTLSATDCDFRDIAITGTAAGSSPTRAGDCGGNSGITFPAGKTVYWNLAGAQNWSATAWAPSSGGSPDINNFPLAQDTVVFDEAAGSVTGTITINAAWNIGTFDASLRTSAMTLTTGSNNPFVYGDWKFGTGVTSSSTTGTVTFAGRGTQTITSNGVTFNCPVTIDCFTGTVQLADALVLDAARTLRLTSGTFDAVTYNVTTGLFEVTVTTNTTLKMGSGTWTLSGTGNFWMASNAPSAFYKGTANIVLSATSTSARSFAGRSLSYNKLTIGGTTGTSTLTISGNNQFTELASTKTVAHTIALGSTTQTFGKWTVTGTAGNVVTLTGTGTNHILAGSSTRDIDYLAMGSIGFAATSPGEFYAGANSTGTAAAPVYRTDNPYIPDPYEPYRVLYLNGDGINGKQNSTFLDSSANNFTITRNGNTTQGSFTPYMPDGYWGAFFDGTGDFLTFNPSTSINIGTSDFTIEAWVYHTGGADDTIYSNSGSFTFTYGVTGALRFFTEAGSNIVTASTAYLSNQWVHVCAVRASGTLKLYQNGVEVASSSSYPSIGNSSSTSYIGRYHSGTIQDWTGYLSNLRVVVGRAVYTSAFTPSTVPLGATSGGQNPPQGTETSLLTCQSNRFVDNSSTPKTITRNGDTRITQFAPLEPPIGEYGGSGYFDGTTDYVSAPASSQWVFSNDVTFECNIYIIGDSALDNNGNKEAVLFRNAVTGTVNFQIMLKGNNTTTGTGLSIFRSNDLSYSVDYAFAKNAWYHIAVIRSSNTWTFYVNGTAIGTPYVFGGSIGSSLRVMEVGGSGYSGYANVLVGYISDARMVNGTAVYTTNFTPPTTPLTAIPNTSLLLNFTNAGIQDLTREIVFETVDGAQVSTAQKKFGNASLYFDGSSDGLYMPLNPVLDFGTGDFTIEFWMRTNGAQDTYSTIMDRSSTAPIAGTTITMAISNQPNNSNRLNFTAGGVGINSTTNVNDNAWHHIACVRSNGTDLYLFIDGVLEASTNTAISTTIASMSGGRIGRTQYNNFTDNNYNGFLDEIIYTRGIAKYTSSFTPESDKTRYWVGGTGNWSDTSRWSAEWGGAGGASVPRSHQDVVFDQGSNATAYTVTVNAVTGGIRMKSLTIAGPASGNVTLAGSTDMVGIHGNVTLPATGLTRTYTGAITLSSNSTGLTFTTNGVTLASAITVNGVDCGWSLGSALDIGSQGLIVTNGSFDLATYNFTVGAISANNNNSRTIDFGTGTTTMSGATPINFGTTETNRANLTVTAGTSQINVSTTSPTFTGNNQTFYNVSFTSTSAGTVTLNGTNTFNNLSFTGITAAVFKNIVLAADQTVTGTLTFSAGTNATMRHFVRSDTIGTTRTITAAAVSMTDVDFRDISIAGAAAPASGTRIGDCKGNSGITFTAPKTVYWVAPNGFVSWNGNYWATGSGGTANLVNFPLAQDTAIIDNNSGAVLITSGTSYNIGTFDASARTNGNWTIAPQFTIHGDWITSSSISYTSSGINVTFAGRTTQNIRTSGVPFSTFGVIINSPGGSVVLQDALSIASGITLTAGTLNCNGYNVSLSSGNFTSTGDVARTINIGSGTFSIFTQVGGTRWNITGSNVSVIGNGGTIQLSTASFAFQTNNFAGNNLDYSNINLKFGNTGPIVVTGNNIFNELIIEGGGLNNGGGGGVIYLNGNNTFTRISSNLSGLKALSLGNTTQRVTTSWTASGSAGNILTVQGTSASSPCTLVFTGSGQAADVDYLAITGVRAYPLSDTWSAGSNSINNGSLGWLFTSPVVATPSSNFFMFFG